MPTIPRVTELTKQACGQQKGEGNAPDISGHRGCGSVDGGIETILLEKCQERRRPCIQRLIRYGLDSQTRWLHAHGRHSRRSHGRTTQHRSTAQLKVERKKNSRGEESNWGGCRAPTKLRDGQDRQPQAHPNTDHPKPKTLRDTVTQVWPNLSNVTMWRSSVDSRPDSGRQRRRCQKAPHAGAQPLLQIAQVMVSSTTRSAGAAWAGTATLKRDARFVPWTGPLQARG